MNNQKRKLAAIVFTDIVGFTKLTSQDQSRASNLLKKQREVFRPIVESHNGDWIKEIGDGLLLTFSTVTDAVNCSIELQKESLAIDGLILRIGIHQGEILIDGDDVIGDDVNVASRIEPFSAPGGVAVSGKVHDSIIREAEFETKYIGKPNLKGVEQKVEVYCITSHGLPETKLSEVVAKLEVEQNTKFNWSFFSLTGAALTIVGILFWINISFLGIGMASGGSIPSISILIPDNLGDEIDDKWMNFLTENIIIDIANLGNVVVTPFRNVLKISSEGLKSDQIENQLNSDYLLYSSVYIDGENFDMNAQLINTKNSKSVFGKKYKENIKSISTVSEKIASEILEGVGLNPDREIAFKGKQERFNDAYRDNDFKKAFEIVKPGDRAMGLVVNIKGDFSYNLMRGTLTDGFYNLFENEILPKIQSSPFDLEINIHTSHQEIPKKSIFKNNLDMTVAIAKNIESYINNLELNNNVDVYGLGDIFPRGLDSIRIANPKWTMEDLDLDLIQKLNSTSKQKISNNRISIGFRIPKP